MSDDPTRPGKNAGQISLRTIELRGPLPLTADQRRRARFLRFVVGKGWAEIAAALGRSEQDIRHALANARTRRKEPGRGTVNVSPATIEHLRSLQQPDEPMWQTVDRLLGL